MRVLEVTGSGHQVEVDFEVVTDNRDDSLTIVHILLGDGVGVDFEVTRKDLHRNILEMNNGQSDEMVFIKEEIVLCLNREDVEELIRNMDENNPEHRELVIHNEDNWFLKNVQMTVDMLIAKRLCDGDVIEDGEATELDELINYWEIVLLDNK